jgi:hypothetical protein
VTISLVATGSPALFYQWRRDGLELAGETNAQLVLSNVSFSSRGNYFVLVSNEFDSVMSSNATLSVLNVAFWGTFSGGIVTNIPVDLTNAVALDCASAVIMTADADGGLFAWGDNVSGQSTFRAGVSNVVGFAGGTSGLAREAFVLLESGAVIPSAYASSNGFTSPPPDFTNVIAIASGHGFVLGLRKNGTLATWGQAPGNPSSVSNAVAIGANRVWMAITSDESLIGSGNIPGLGTVPSGLSNVVAVSCGSFHNVALKRDGTVYAWGSVASPSQTNVPPGLSNAIAVAAGDFFSAVLKRDGSVIVFGIESSGAHNVPVELTNVVAIAAGSGLCAALINDDVASYQAPPMFLNPQLVDGVLRINTPTHRNRTYMFEYKDSLSATNWIRHDAIAGNGSTNTVTLTPASGSQRVFRVQQH